MGWWVLVFSVVLAAMAVVDVSIGADGAGHRLYLWTLSVAVATGAFHGLLWGLGYEVLSRVHRFAARIFWPLLGLALAAWLSSELGVFDRLMGKHQRLAVIALSGSVFAGAGVGLGALLVQPSAAHPRGWLGSRHWAIRGGVVFALLLGSVATFWVDRNIEQGGHHSAHLALQVAGFWAIAFAIMIGVPRFPRLPRGLRETLVLVGIALSVFTSMTLKPDAETEIHLMLDRPYSSLALESAREVGDLDRDQYSAILGGTDCDPFDPAVNPGAREIPGNGIDDNCRRGDAGLEPIAVEDVEWPKEPSPTSVVLITIDTVSAPHMSLYGKQRKTTPNIDRWAKRAAVFENAFTSGGWTSLAIPSLFRGVWVRRLRWTRLMETSDDRLLRFPYEGKLREGERAKMTFGLPVDDPRPPLAEWLRERGMHTVAVVNDGSAEFLDPEFSGQGFDVFHDMDDMMEEDTPVYDADVTRAAIDALEEMPEGKPFFLWVHYFGPHYGNTRHRGFDKFGFEQGDRYDHELLYMDKQVYRLLREVRRKGRNRNIAVVLTSDHGEVIHKEGRGHGRDLREAAIRVPLLVRADGFEPGRYEAATSIVDILPTILDMTESPHPPDLDGVALQRVVAGDPSIEGRVLLTDTWRFDKNERRKTDMVGAIDGELKLTWDLVKESKTLRKSSRKEERRQNLLGDPAYDYEHLDEALEAYIDENGAATLGE